MKILSFKSPNELALATENNLIELYEKQKHPLRGFLPTGNSVKEFYELLQFKKDFWKDKLELIQIDEFSHPSRRFYHDLERQIIKPLGLQKKSELIDPHWEALDMQRHIQKVLSRPIDFAVLGLGPNGHIGFHEPGVGGMDFLGGEIYLSESSYNRVKNAPSRSALSFGAGSFLKAKRILLIVSGSEKVHIYQKFLSEDPNPEIPATLIKNHPELYVLSLL